ncbi:deoxyribonuclease [Xylanimonas oleitrophica]|uniref:Deoxyribonuclease n=1 Tax=Xylanimonas oleitrophica TaxID=2607479 RepID=A0A2W5WXD1_9MICO|nr:DUF1524 domain-containing protein [Xylanimonas oleitrophica]PZR52946.1 deoxyribonuclease [Xylanimonas oleitrophica]
MPSHPAARRRPARPGGIAALVLTAALTLGACAAPATTLPGGAPAGAAAAPSQASAPAQGAEAAPGSAAAPAAGTTSAQGTALAAVPLLEVKGRAPKTGYSRDHFGPAWADTDRNGCDQRNDVLRRDLADFTTRPGSKGCVVLTGTFHDPYSGETIAFQRGQDTSALVQIDHVVALSDAWQKGAQQWDAGKRREFANDPLNLLASKGSLNQQKGDGDTATWLPPNRAFRCAYVARQVSVKVSYALWVTAAERDAMTEVLSGCPDEPLLTEDPVPAPDPATESAEGAVAAAPAAPAAPAEAPAPAPAAPEAAAGAPAPADVYYASCTEARAAGAAPVRVGDPGYRAGLDRDGDGVGCE